MKANIEARRTVLANGLDKEWREARKASYKGDNTLLDDFSDCFGEDLERTCRNLEQSRMRKARKARQKIGRCVVSGNAFFLTLTFRDDILANTSEKTRRRYVSRILKAIGYKYVANIDYGKTTEREHYHAIIDPYPFCLDENGKPDLSEWTSNYGFVKVEKVGNSETDLKKVAKYTAKLSAHALKESTLKGKIAPRLIYSR